MTQSSSQHFYYLVRSFAWLMVTTMLAFIVNTYFTLALEWPVIFLIFDNKINLDFSDYFKIFVEIVIYMISLFIKKNLIFLGPT